VHRARPAGEHGPQLLAVHQLGNADAGVADQVGDVLNAHPGARKQRHKAVPQLARGPLLRVQAGGRGHPTERAADVRRVQCGAGTRSSVMGKIITVAADNTNS
jgi:hypothetical protein